jgi:hypothetical protein
MTELALRWDLRVTNCVNGYRATWLEECEDETRVMEMVFEAADTEIGELEAMKNLLWFVKEHFGIYLNKHNQQNLVIEIQDMNT